MGELTIFEYIDKDVSNAMVITGFPTVGMVGTIVANYLVSHLELELLGGIYSDETYPASVIEGGRPIPPLRIYSGDKVCGPDDECDQLVVITSELPLKPSMVHPVADVILRWCKSKKCNMIVGVEGFNHQDEDEEIKIYHIGGTERMRDHLSALGTESLQSGIIGGVTGVLLYRAPMIWYDVGCLFTEAHTEFPDSRAAAAILATLNKLVPQIELDPEPLLKQATEVESMLKNAMDQARRMQLEPGEAQAPHGMYR